MDNSKEASSFSPSGLSVQTNGAITGVSRG